jgi:hypothetical protein
MDVSFVVREGYLLRLSKIAVSGGFSISPWQHHGHRPFDAVSGRRAAARS